MIRKIITIACLIILIIIIAYWRYTKSPRVRRARKYKKIVALDNPEERKALLREHEDQNLDDLDADELFTLATMFLREHDDLQDNYDHATNSKVRADIARRMQNVSRLARDTIQLAIAKRSNENQTNPNDTREAQLFHDAAIERRADEIAAVVPDVHHDVPRRPIGARIVPPAPEAAAGANGGANDAAGAPVIPAPQWAPDPENVHDSAIGGDVTRRLNFIREQDLNLFDTRTCLGEIAFILADRCPATNPQNAPKRERIIRTMERARQNDHCDRYDINELEALRLVMERSHFAKTEEGRNNLHDALLNAMSECSEGNGTVCTVGRISRYVASLDVVDENLPDGGAVKSVDAYRAEILNKLGQAQAAPNSTEQTVRAQLDRTIAEYADRVPANYLEKIRTECVAAL